MKLTFLLLTVVCLQVSAGALSQEVSISVKNASIEKVLKEISKQSGYAFFYDAGYLQHARKVSLDVKRAPVKEVLDICFADQPFTYTVMEKTILIRVADKKEKEGENQPPVIQLTITGKVTDEKGAPLAGVTVRLKGTSIMTTTNDAGEFTINAPGAGGKLEISYVGYEPEQVDLKNRTSVNIQLSVRQESMNQIVVVGFGTQKKIDLTGAVTQVDGKVVENRSVANVGQALQGVIPNLNLTTTGDPGGPGQNATFNVRGNTSLRGEQGASPLIVIDGIPAENINDINPADVESITVLKDAAASAIYGARAPYGVILIMTKKGRKNQKALVSYSGMAGQSSYTRLPKMANSVDFATAYNAASLNSGQGAPFSDAILGQLKDNLAHPGTHPASGPDPSDPTRYTYASPLNLDNVDWFKAYFKPWTPNQKHDLSISGGNQNTTYYIGGGFYDQDGQLRYGKENFKRYNITSNIHTEPASWARLDLRSRFSNRKTNIPFDYAGQMGNWIHMATTRQPNWALKNPDGHFSHASNMEFMNNGGRRITTDNDLTLTGSVELEPIRNWKINADYSYNTRSSRYIWHSAYVYAWALDGSKYNIGPSVNSVGEGTVTDGYKSLNVYSSYEKSIGKHYMKLLVGQQTELRSRFDVSGTRADLITDQLPSISIATGTQNAYDAMSESSTMGTFGRINYNYDEKYLLEVNGRYDGTSKFPQSRRFGFFPSVSAGYVLSKENFWNPLADYVNTLKVRASYGSLGNQNVDPYQYLATVPIFTNLPYILNNIRPNYLGAPGLISADLTWETSRTFDVGADAMFLKNKLAVTYDWYKRTTLNSLGPAQALPATLGTAVPKQNNADITTKGFELSVSWKDQLANGLGYNVSVVMSDYISVVKRYYNPTKILSTFYNGLRIGDIWGYETSRLAQTPQDIQSMPDQSFFFGRWTPGDVIYTDLNNDKKITNGKNTLDDPGDMKVIGNNTPRYSYGINLGLTWKGIDFSMFWQGVGKRDLWLGAFEGNNSGSIFWGFTPGFGNNVYETTLDYWTPQNTGAYWPKPYLSGEARKNHQVQSAYLQNGAYLRLKNVQVGYDLAELFKRHPLLKKCRLFITGENLITISKINKNYDPEVVNGSWGSGKIYPLLKTVSIGANISF